MQIYFFPNSQKNSQKSTNGIFMKSIAAYFIELPKETLNYLSLKASAIPISKQQLRVLKMIDFNQEKVSNSYWIGYSIKWDDFSGDIQYKLMKSLQSSANLAEIESRLNKYSYLSKNTLPGSPDGKVFAILEANKNFPDRKNNPNFYHWYILMKQFSPTTIMKWVKNELYQDNEDSLIGEFVKSYSPKKDTAECTELGNSECRLYKLESSTEIEYSIDIAVKDYNPEKINSLRKLLDQADMTEDEINNSKYIRIICRIDPANLDEFSGKISKCVEFNELSLRKKDMKGQKPVAPAHTQKVQ